jgi:pyruvate/2-oxoglutarate dehydrogenase complex dihydrolipoamide dehydrogenase (E3) component
VEVRLNSEVTAETITAIKPDVVIISTGSTPFIPHIQGMNQTQVIKATDVLMGRQSVGNRVVILGGGRIGCETAEYLSLKGKQVILSEEGYQIGSDIPPRIRMFLIPRLIREGVKIMNLAHVEGVYHSGVTFSILGKIEKVEADSVIIALGFVPRTELVDALEQFIPEIKQFFVIGDCAEPRSVREAVYDGWRIGRII